MAFVFGRRVEKTCWGTHEKFVKLSRQMHLVTVGVGVCLITHTPIVYDQSP
jgi:hypothetical protein